MHPHTLYMHVIVKNAALNRENFNQTNYLPIKLLSQSQTVVKPKQKQKPRLLPGYINFCFFFHDNLMKNTTQTAVINIFKIRILYT